MGVCVSVYVRGRERLIEPKEGSSCESRAPSATAKVFHYLWLAHAAGEMEIERETGENEMTQLKNPKALKPVLLYFKHLGLPHLFTPFLELSAQHQQSLR